MARAAYQTHSGEQQFLGRGRALFTAPEPYPGYPSARAKDLPRGMLEDIEAESGGVHEENTDNMASEGDGPHGEGSSGLGQPGTRGRDKRRPSNRSTSAKSPGNGSTILAATGANCRYDSSLGLLTKKFIALVEGAPDGVLDLNKAAESLQVQKRRIYDITNVLEGIGLIEKKSKNNIQWKGNAPAGNEELHAEYKALQEEVAALNEDSQTLEQHIKSLQDNLCAMTEHKANKSRMYVTNDDIVKLQSIGRDTVFAVTAPNGTTLVVPDPDEALEAGGQRRYKAILTSRTDAIGVWLVSSNHMDGDYCQPPGAMLARPPEEQSLAVPQPVLKVEEPAYGEPGPSSVGMAQQRMQHGLGGGGMGSPSFMKLQTPGLDPDGWFSQEAPQLGVGDIFGDSTM